MGHLDGPREVREGDTYPACALHLHPSTEICSASNVDDLYQASSALEQKAHGSGQG